MSLLVVCLHYSWSCVLESTCYRLLLNTISPSFNEFSFSSFYPMRSILLFHWLIHGSRYLDHWSLASTTFWKIYFTFTVLIALFLMFSLLVTTSYSIYVFLSLFLWLMASDQVSSPYVIAGSVTVSMTFFFRYTGTLLCLKKSLNFLNLFQTDGILTSVTLVISFPGVSNLPICLYSSTSFNLFQFVCVFLLFHYS